jgi:hypothetical protein
MKPQRNMLEPLNRDFSQAITLWVVALHTLIHLVTIFIQTTASIGNAPATLPFHRLTQWTTAEWLLGVSILSLAFVLSTVVMATLTGDRSYPPSVGLFQLALAVGTCVYAMVLNHLFAFMAFGR